MFRWINWAGFKKAYNRRIPKIEIILPYNGERRIFSIMKRGLVSEFFKGQEMRKHHKPAVQSKSVVDEKTFPSIIKYIEKNGFGEPTPLLAKGLSPDVFQQHYYTVQELLAFCRKYGISAQGQRKPELNSAIEAFLRDGTKGKKIPFKKTAESDSKTGPITPERQVVSYKSDDVTRNFMQRHIAGFTGFSAAVQKWIKEELAAGELLTYQDIINKHKDFLRNKAKPKNEGQRKLVAHESCEYNQFSIDYNQDLASKPHTSREAWALVRDSAGEKTYARYRERIEEIADEIVQKKVPAKNS